MFLCYFSSPGVSFVPFDDAKLWRFLARSNDFYVFCLKCMRQLPLFCDTRFLPPKICRTKGKTPSLLGSILRQGRQKPALLNEASITPGEKYFLFGENLFSFGENNFLFGVLKISFGVFTSVTALRLVGHGITAHAPRHYGSSVTALRLVFLNKNSPYLLLQVDCPPFYMK